MSELYKTEIKIIYSDPTFLICKAKKRPHFRLEANFLKSHVIMKDICNKFIEKKILWDLWFGHDANNSNSSIDTYRE